MYVDLFKLNLLEETGILCLIDDLTRRVWIYLIKTKNEVFEAFNSHWSKKITES